MSAKTYFLLWLIIFIGWFLIGLYTLTWLYKTQNNNPYDIEDVKYRMRYHGTKIVYVIDGNLYFKRHGRLVPLWNPKTHHVK